MKKLLRGPISIILYVKHSNFILLVRILTGKQWNPLSGEFKQEKALLEDIQ